MKKIFTLISCALIASATTFAQEESLVESTTDFEDINLATDSYDKGVNANGKFTSGDFNFVNEYHSDYDYFYGFAISTQTSTAYSALTDQFNSCVGTGADGSKTYSVCYFSSWAAAPIAITNKDSKTFYPQSVAVTNAAYAFTSMRTGDAYAKKFDQTDWFKVTFIGEKNGEQTGTVTVDLAKDAMLLFTWKTVDLSSLGEVDNIRFSMESSDSGMWGMNTPAYFCIDNFKANITSTTTQIKATNATSKNASVIGIYTTDGKQVISMTKGLNILRMSDGTVRKIYK